MKTLILSLAVMALAAVIGPIAGAAGTVPGLALEKGTSYPLPEMGAYRMGYKLNGQKQAWMTDGWSGHFEPVHGLSMCPFGTQNGREVLLMHSPWRKGAGIAFAEYDVSWPASEGLGFDFHTALKADVIDKSDGVGYRVFVDGKRVFDTLEKGAEWRRHHVDVSINAKEPGHAVLRLEVNPGPAGNPSFDYSYWGDPVLNVGGSRPDMDTSSASLNQDTMDNDLKRYLNDSDPGCMPSAGLSGRTSVRRDDASGSYLLSWAPADNGGKPFTVRINPGEGILSGIRVERDGGVIPLFAGASASPGHRLDGAGIIDGRVVLRYSPAKPGTAGNLEVTLALKGANLVTEVAEQTAPTRFKGEASIDFGTIGAVPLRRELFVPYLSNFKVMVLRSEGLFVGMGNDWHTSMATSTEGGMARYGALTDGTRNTIRERYFVSVGADLPSVLPNIPHKPSAWRAELSKRVVADVWGGSFATDALSLRAFRSYGIKDLALIYHVWQRDGYDVGLPNHYPANEGMGGSEGLKELSRVAASMGIRFSLHENYIDMYPQSSYYDEGLLALESDGKPQKAWYQPSTQVQSHAIKPPAMAELAAKESPPIQRGYGTNASYLDVNSCTPPWFHVDMRAGEPDAGSMEAVRKGVRSLFELEQRIHQGPLLGEGNNHFYWAGLVDGVEAQVVGGEDAPLLLEFDLLKLHPQMVNHGMGYPERWFRTGYGEPEWGPGPVPERAWDKYRASQMALGHAGFVSSRTFSDPEAAVKEYYLAAAVQEELTGSDPKDILYYPDDATGPGMTATRALLAGIHPLPLRMRIDYVSGLTVWVNRSEKPWTLPVSGRDLPGMGRGVSQAVGERITLPSYGYLACGTRGASGTVEVAGKTADIALTREWYYVNARGAGEGIDFGGLKTRGALVARPSSEGLRLIPVPRETEQEVTLFVPRIADLMEMAGNSPKGVWGRDAKGARGDAIGFRRGSGGGIVLTLGGDGWFDYLVPLIGK